MEESKRTVSVDMEMMLAFLGNGLKKDLEKLEDDLLCLSILMQGDYIVTSIEQKEWYLTIANLMRDLKKEHDKKQEKTQQLIDKIDASIKAFNETLT